jgi:hypothetical protein
MPVTKSLAHYVRLDPTTATRLVGGSAEEFAFADGDPAPALRRGGGFDGNVGQDFPSYSCSRFAPYFGLGNMAIEQAEYQVIAANARAMATRAATIRAQKVMNVINNAANYANTDTATDLGGGKWDVSSSTLLYIKKSINKAVRAIALSTGGCLQDEDLCLVIGVDTAQAINTSDEIQGILQRSPFALESIEGRPTINAKWGLPSQLYGLNLVVDDTVITESNLGAASTDSTFCFPRTDAAVFARPGNPQGFVELPTDSNEAMTFGALTVFSMEDLSIQIEPDHPLSRRQIGQSVENSDVQMTAPVSAYLITGVIS